MSDFAGVDPARLASSLDVPPSQLDRVLDIYPEGFGTDPAEVTKLVRPRMVNGPIVDIGSGFGQVAIALASEYDMPVQGIEAHPHLVREARSRARAAGVEHLCTFKHANLNSWLPRNESKFQLVLALSIWGIFGDFPDTASALARLVRPNGYVVTNLSASSPVFDEVEDQVGVAKAHLHAAGLVLEYEHHVHWERGGLKLATARRASEGAAWQANRDRVATQLESVYIASSMLVCRSRPNRRSAAGC